MARELPIRKARAGGQAPPNEGRDTERGQANQRSLVAATATAGGAAVLESPVDVAATPATTDQRTIAPRPTPASSPRRWTGFPTRITLEGLLYLLIGCAAVLSRFWNLGQQAQHHDESLHSYFSWLYYVGSGYTHDPLMHGPFLFHIASISYLIFGDSDASSRYGAALFGAATVLLPWFLRRELGRWGALTASVLLLTSPSFLYFGRFHRHDVYSAFLTLLFFIAIARYVARSRPAWAITGAAAWAFLFTNKEDFFIVTAIFGSALVFALLWPAARRVLFLGVGFVVALGVAAKVLPKLLGWPSLPAIPWDSPSNDAIRTYIIAFVAHPVVLCGGLLLIGFGVLTIQAFSSIAAGKTWADGLFGHFPAGTPMAAARELFSNKRVLTIAAVTFVGIYVVLYTSLFTNLGGIFTGSFGAIFYWLGQHDVRRAEQPWFYYLLLMPQYDPLSVILGVVGVALTGWRLLAHRLLRRAEGPFPFVRGLMAYWALATIAIYSWAGEKMPWMDIHLVLPLLLFTATLIGTVLEKLFLLGRERLTQPVAEGDGAAVAVTRGRVVSPRSPWVVVAALLVAIGGWFFGAARLSMGGVGAEGRGWWLLLLPLLVAVAIGVGYGLWAGWTRAGQTLLVAFTAAMLLFHVHAGWALAFQTGDVPKDLLVYVQSSPDVTRVSHELAEFSRLKTGGLGLSVLYDDNTSWPFQWYLRNYTNKQYFGCTPGASCTLVDPPAEDVAVVLVGNDNLSSHPELTSLLSNYQATSYAMRWHFPEEVYRSFAIAPELPPGYWSAWAYQEQPHDLRAVFGSVMSSLITTATPDGQAKLFRLLTYRELGAPLGSYDFTVFVRKDLVPEYNTVRYK